MAVNPYGYDHIYNRDYEAIAECLGFVDGKHVRDFAKEQQEKAYERAANLDRRNDDAKFSSSMYN